jgi:Conserved hypothetical ATP binding protein
VLCGGYGALCRLSQYLLEQHVVRVQHAVPYPPPAHRVLFNKTDVVSHEFCLEWMRDSEAFQQALDDTAETLGFYGSLTRSLSLVLDEFYSNFTNRVECRQ